MVAVVGFGIGFGLDLLTFKVALLVLFGVVAGLVVSLPYAWSLRVLFVYLGFEGMAKLLTGYNPVVHVGADLLVGALTLRWIAALLLKKTEVSHRPLPLLPLLVAHFAWYLIQFANPFSIGLIPSLAGAKVYVTMVLLYAFGFHLAKDLREVRLFMLAWVAVLAIQVVTGLAQSALGPASVLAISPNYAEPLRKFDASYAFRPFGTTNLPGAASLYVSLGTAFVLYFLITARSWLAKWSIAFLIPGAVALVLLCQVRATFLKVLVGTALFLVLVALRASVRARRAIFVSIPVAAAFLFVSLPYVTDRWVEDRRGIDRTLSLFDPTAVSSARSGTADRVMMFAERVPLGAGLSRTGAAAGKFWWENQRDPFFPRGFFTDNFWAATVAEIGIPGSAILTAIILSILWIGIRGILRIADPERRTVMIALLVPLATIVMGLWTAEGLLYNPEAAFFWFFSGALMRLAQPCGIPQGHVKRAA